MRAYIAGPMTGLPNYNFSEFFAAEDRLAWLGYDTVNPARHDEEMGWVTVVRDGHGGILSATKVAEDGFDWATALEWDIEQLEFCDVIYLLPGWSRSRGASKEYAFALANGLAIAGAKDEAHVPTETQPLVGLIGFAQAGKDSVAGYLGYARLAFADPLKRLAAASRNELSVLVDMIGWERAKAEVPGVREFLQDLGVGVRDVLGANTWVEAAFAKYDPSLPTVFTDVRFPNEVEAIQARGGVIVRVTREGLEPPNAHISEQLVRTVAADYEITAAAGDMESLRSQAIKLDLELRP